jgi:hypothetical protein
MIPNISPSAKVAERNAKAEAARLQGEAVITALNTVRDTAVLAIEEENFVPETVNHEKTEPMADRVIEYGSPLGGMH